MEASGGSRSPVADRAISPGVLMLKSIKCVTCLLTGRAISPAQSVFKKMIMFEQ